jgi:hypothetical protein
MPNSLRPVSSFRTRSNNAEAPASKERARASMTESLPSPHSTLRSRRTVRPGFLSSSSSRPGEGARTFWTTAPLSSGSSARATSRSSLGLSDTTGSLFSKKRNGPAIRRAVRFSRRRVTSTSSWSAASPSAQPASSSRSSSSSSAPSVHPSGVSVRHSGRVSGMNGSDVSALVSTNRPVRPITRRRTRAARVLLPRSR